MRPYDIASNMTDHEKTGQEEPVKKEPQPDTDETKPPKKTRRRWRVFLFALVFLLAAGGLLYAYRVPLMIGVARALVYESAPEPCDVIIVLGGGGTLRVQKAVELVGQGYAGEILITLPETLADDAIAHDLIMIETMECRAVLRRHGIVDENVHWCDDPFYSTYDEARFIRRWMDENGKRSAIIIPGLFQSRRAKWTLDHFFRDSDVKLLVIPAAGRFTGRDDWWTHEEGIITVENELIKNAYYVLKTTFSRD